MILVGDIGGTNTRLALFKLIGGEPSLLVLRKYPSASWASFPQLIKSFLNETISIAETNTLQAAGFCFAGPIKTSFIRLTNLNLTLDLHEIRQELNFIPQLHIYNDLEALAYGVITAKPQDLLCLHPGSATANKINDNFNKAIIAPGTGLGEAFIINNNIVCTGEGGHCDFAPQSEEEIQLWRFLHEKFDHVSIERVLSGPGLVNIYQFLSEYYFPQKKDGPLPVPETISHKALTGDCPLCEQSLNIFTRVLGAEAGNLALKTLSLRGVYLGGGITPKILPKLKEQVFLESFQNKGRFKDMMKQIPVFVILNEDLPLMGAASRLSALGC